MNAFVARHGTDFDPFRMAPAAFWRDAAFWWLSRAHSDRTIAALAGRSADPSSAATRASAITESRAAVAKVRDLAAKARELGCRLP